MSDFTIRKLEEIEAINFGSFLKVRAALGVKSFGIQIIELPPNSGELYPEHEHTEDKYEEVYVVLRGDGQIEIEGESFAIDPNTLVRVGSSARRRIRSGDQGLKILALAGIPGEAYSAPPFTELGAPDPTA